MAQQFITNSGIVLTEPGTYVSPQVINNQSGVPTLGVVTLIGEADEGPDFSTESDLDANSFSPDQIGSVIQKYGTGRLVDAFRELVSASSDPAIVGAVNLIKLVKTNPSVAAAATVSRNGFGSYATMAAVREGAGQNLIKYSATPSVAEVPPTSGAFSYTPHYGTTQSLSLRADGGTALAVSVTAAMAGDAFVAACSSYTLGMLATGGAAVLPLTGFGAGTTAISCAAGAAPAAWSSAVSYVIDDVATNGGKSYRCTAAVQSATVPGSDTTHWTIGGDTLVVTVAAALSGMTAGDTVVIPRDTEYAVSGDSVIVGTLKCNAGAYILQSVVVTSSTVMTLKRINGPDVNTTGTASGFVSAGVDEFIVYPAITVANYCGMDRNVFSGLTTPTTTTAGSYPGNCTLTISAPWTAQPLAGDYLVLSSAASNLAAGYYLVVSSTTTGAVISRVSNGTWIVSNGAGGSTANMKVYKPTVDGLGKSLEFVGDYDQICRSPSTYAAFAHSNSMIASTAEYKVSFTVSQGLTSETNVIGGDIVLAVGCTTPLATVVIGATQMDFKVSGTTQFSVAYAQYQTLQDVAALISQNTGFTAAVTQSKYLFVNPSQLDRGTFGISAATSSMLPGRFKYDSDRFSVTENGSGLISAVAVELSGLPETQSVTFFSGGSKGGTTAAQFVLAIDACEAVETNFIVPLVSKDATLDIADGDTESSSTYTVDAVNAYVKSHVLAQSAVQARKNRIALVSKSGTYTVQKAAAGDLASYRVGMAFQDVKVVNSSGVLEQYQPWMAAVVAAGMQAAAGYKGIVKKFANVYGIVKPEGDFNSTKYGDRIDALQAGLLILEKVPTGGYRWVSDQLTYSQDNNFVYNSLQAVYIADLMILTMITDFDRAVVGKSVAEISAAGALSFLDGECFNFKRLRWIAASDDAPKGYKNASVRITGGVMQISLEVKLAGLIYFVPITFSISEVSQTATA